MLRYFLKRLALVVPTFLGITIVCFALVQAVPGGPVEQRLAALRGLGGGGAGQLDRRSGKDTKGKGRETRRLRKTDPSSGSSGE